MCVRCFPFGFVCAGLCACYSWMMMNTLLDDGATVANSPGQYLGIDQCAAAQKMRVVKNPFPVEFEGTVDVTDFHAEEQADEFCPAPGVDFANEAVLTIDAVAAYNVVFLDQWQQGRHFGDVKLAVTVGVEDKFLSGYFEAGLQCCAVSQIFGVMDDFYSVVFCGDF